MMKATPKAGIITSLLVSGGWGLFSFGRHDLILTCWHLLFALLLLFYGIIPWRGNAGRSAGNQSSQLLDDDDDKASGPEPSTGLFDSTSGWQKSKTDFCMSFVIFSF